MTDPGDPRLRFRIYLDGKLHDERWLDSSNPDYLEHVAAAQRDHAAIAQQADDDGVPWCVETYDPAKPPRTAYMRIGTDTAAMIAPRPWDGGQP